jgi:hypothetical protein
MENHHFSWENPLLMAIFNSYVKLPEGRYLGLGVEPSKDGRTMHPVRDPTNKSIGDY